MKIATVLGIFAVSMCLGVAACSDSSSGTTQGNTGQNEETKKKIPLPPRQQIECAKPGAGSCAEDCCDGDNPFPDGGDGCPAWLKANSCERGISNREPNLFAPRE